MVWFGGRLVNAGAKVGHQQETGDNLGVAEIYGYDESRYAYFFVVHFKAHLLTQINVPFQNQRLVQWRYEISPRDRLRFGECAWGEKKQCGDHASR